ncbi:MAG: hypothetical protein WC538_18580 [Thermoanaerobaculia bacterium]|jgi:DUF4097 and DUF4098 domain-containing protein YvlB
MAQARAAALAIAIFAPTQLVAAEANRLTKAFNDKSTRTVDVRAGGMLWIDNAIGSIIVTGGNDKVVVETMRVLRAGDDATLEALKKKANVIVEGTSDSRIVKSVGLVSSQQALARIDYVVKVPTGTQINVLSGVAEQVNVSGISGKLYLRNWRGKVEITDVSGPIQVDAVNTFLKVSFSQIPTAGAMFTSVNGNVEIRVPRASKFEWYAETMKGDILAGFPVKGRVVDRAGQRTFHSSVNGGGSAALRAASITGSVYLMPLENLNAQAASVLPQAPQPAPMPPPAIKEDVGSVYRSVVASLLVVPPSARVFEVRKGRVAGNYDFAADLGENVFVGEIEGFARIVAGGGEVVLGRVAGDCKVGSQGGPINLGEIGGAVDARTLAGDVTVGNAKKGGRVYTGGGSIAIRRAAGPLILESNGGDVIVLESSSRVSAETPSGDVRVRLDARGATEPSDLRTGRGHAILEIPKAAKVTIDATITMAADGAYRFESEFPGLTVVRERVGDGMRIRATGKINGGGPLMTINVASGNVALRRSPEKVAAPAARR